MTEREAYFFAFGPNPEPECDGAGRDCFAEIMREMRRLRGDQTLEQRVSAIERQLA